MNKRTVLAVAMLVCLLGSVATSLLSTVSAENSGVMISGRVTARAAVRREWKLGTPVQFRNLSVFPVIGARRDASGQFITLDTALKSGQVKVTEMGAGSGQQGSAQVNQLSLENKSGKPLVLLAGEMLLGGQQDRIDASDRIVPASERPTALAVFCVEPGRWNGAEQFGVTARSEHSLGSVRRVRGSGSGFNMGGGDPAPGVGVGSGAGIGAGPGAGGASGGTAGDVPRVAVGGSGFALAQLVPGVAPTTGAIGGMANSTVRAHAEVSNDQAKVWNSVEVTAVANQVVTRSGSLQHVYDDRRVSGRLALYSRAFTGKMGPNVVGVVVAINGKAQLADVFAGPEIFQQYWPKLLKSYALEAISARPRRDAPAPVGSARAFLAPAQGEPSTESEEGVYRLTRRSTPSSSSFELEFTGGPTPVLVHFNRILSKASK